MRCEHDIALAREEADRFGQIVGPRLGVAHQRAARRQDVVHRDVGVFGHEHGAKLRQIEIHLRGRLGAWRQFERQRDPVDRHFLTSLCN